MRGLFQSERAHRRRLSAVNAVDHQAMPPMLTEGAIDWDGFCDQIAPETDAVLGSSQSVLVIDESAFAKKGASSAGVARPWNGRLGTVDNCQVGVFATLCRGELTRRLDARLDLPKAWADEAARCRKAAIPAEARDSRRKTDLALAMVSTAIRRGIRCGYVGVEGGYGKEPAFLRGLDRLGCRFVADGHCDQTIYLENPDPKVPLWSGRGKRPLHLQAQSAPVRVDPWAAEQPPEAWQRLTLRGGEKGQLVAEYRHARVWVGEGTETPARCGPLLVRRELGARAISHSCLANAPAHVPWPERARVQAQRYFIAHSFREAKSECGLADDPVRRWEAGPHHRALVMLGTLFLVKPKSEGRNQGPMRSFNDLVTALAHRLPRRPLTAEDLAALITQRHRLRQQAKESHARRSMAALE